MPAQVLAWPCPPTPAGPGTTPCAPTCRYHTPIHRSLTYYCPQIYLATVLAQDSTCDTARCLLFIQLSLSPTPLEPSPSSFLEVSQPLISMYSFLHSVHGCWPRAPPALVLNLLSQLLRFLQKGKAGPVEHSLDRLSSSLSLLLPSHPVGSSLLLSLCPVPLQPDPSWPMAVSFPTLWYDLTRGGWERAGTGRPASGPWCLA